MTTEIDARLNSGHELIQRLMFGRLGGRSTTDDRDYDFIR